MIRDSLVERFQKLRKDPMEFLKAVHTRDEVDRKNPIKRFPWEKAYVQFLVKMWLRERLLVVPKSRRMTASWTFIALYTWDTMFNVARTTAFVSKKEDDSDELVKRSVFIIENLDKDIVPKEIIPKYNPSFCQLEFPEISSKIMGFPSGADQLRQFTFSGIFADEMAFWDNAEQMFSASFPTIEGKGEDQGGRFTGVSSPQAGFFQRLVFDQLDDKESLEAEYENS